ncbi:CpaE family protein [Azospirillum sp. B506]|uniref:AAA family ATPase n=1 Tax=Azospirillum sp. B506 TaxID=137721 RepID=UPI0003498070|nr:AAA family ATPase [Azospirillum sp. B506]
MSIFARATADTAGSRNPELVAFVTDPDTERTIRDLVDEEVMTFTVVRRGSVQDAIGHLRASPSPKLLVVDISDSAMPMSDVEALADVCEPSVTVIVLGESNDIGLFRDLMNAGVADYVAKPITTELLRRTIAMRSGPTAVKPRSRTGKVIAVTGARGGVGGSTLLVNLAWLLSHRSGRKVALVDLDLQASSLSLMLGVDPGGGLSEALQSIDRVDDLFLDRIMQQCSERLFLLTGQEELEDEPPLAPSAIQQIATLLTQRFHYVMLDVPRRYGPLYQHFLSLAHVRIVVADSTLPSVRETVRILRMTGRDDIGKRALVILNHRCPPTKGIVSRDEFEKAIGRRIDYEIPFDRKALAAENGGIPLATEHGAITDTLLDVSNDLSGKRPMIPNSFKRMFWS